MSIISGEELKGLVEDMIDRVAQTQMCGLELTLKKA
ncbi:MAG: deoxyuridine 5'-triphosphate nucleotidohydrolase, partial [Methanosarcinales archaeon]|nr:deoxyuridine 5'-triphosphate nucleotidohydrolase [Methanosarcinales archaeon]